MTLTSHGVAPLPQEKEITQTSKLRIQGIASEETGIAVASCGKFQRSQVALGQEQKSHKFPSVTPQLCVGLKKSKSNAEMGYESFPCYCYHLGLLISNMKQRPHCLH